LTDEDGKKILRWDVFPSLLARRGLGVEDFRLQGNVEDFWGSQLSTVEIVWKLERGMQKSRGRLLTRDDAEAGAFRASAIMRAMEPHRGCLLTRDSP
jgi:hypothetical protein